MNESIWPETWRPLATAEVAGPPEGEEQKSAQAPVLKDPRYKPGPGPMPPDEGDRRLHARLLLGIARALCRFAGVAG